MTRGTLAVLLLLLVTGCGRSVEGGPPDLPDLPDYDLQVCGWLNEPGALECFEDARVAGEGAELFVEIGTVEGDPVYEIVRTTPAGDLEVYIDTSADRFAGDYESHTVQICDGIQYHDASDGEIIPEIVGCSPSQDGW